MNKNYTLSIVIPARNEMFLSRTVQDILKNKEGDTEVIVILDGLWADPGIEDHEDVKIIYLPESIGQRAATNLGVRLSKSRYIMKADAHCAFDQGFDVKLMADMQDNWTMVPIMRNLHIFNWICEDGHTRYQGPSGPCQTCGKETKMDVVWIPKQSPQSKSYCFDSEPHFQYFNEFSKRPEGHGDLTESMSIQGSCFMVTKDRYLKLNLCDEEFGSWGSQGIEVAAKTWLSGGKVIINHKTWYAHCFRTQGGDFGFPYENPDAGKQHAKEYARELFFKNNWDKAIHPLSWLVERFWPVRGWTEEDLKNLKECDNAREPTKNIIFYTDNQLNLKIAHAVQKQLRNISKEKNIPIVSASLKPMPHFGKNIHLQLERGIITYFKQIIAALEASTADIIYMCEHDILYSPTHFDLTPDRKDKFYYNQNWIKVRYGDYYSVAWDANQVSGLSAYRELLLDFYRKRLKEVEQNFNRSYEPGGRDSNLYVIWRSKEPNIDIRHDGTLTKSKWSLNDFRDKSTAKNFRILECPEWAKNTLK